MNRAGHRRKMARKRNAAARLLRDAKLVGSKPDLRAMIASKRAIFAAGGQTFRYWIERQAQRPPHPHIS